MQAHRNAPELSATRPKVSLAVGDIKFSYGNEDSRTMPGSDRYGPTFWRPGGNEIGSAPLSAPMRPPTAGARALVGLESHPTGLALQPSRLLSGGASQTLAASYWKLPRHGARGLRPTPAKMLDHGQLINGHGQSSTTPNARQEPRARLASAPNDNPPLVGSHSPANPAGRCEPETRRHRSGHNHLNLVASLDRAAAAANLAQWQSLSR